MASTAPCPEDIARGCLAGLSATINVRLIDSPVSRSGHGRYRRPQNTGGARLKILVHRDAAVDGKTCLFRNY
jgi:hypothetical protein